MTAWELVEEYQEFNLGMLPPEGYEVQELCALANHLGEVPPDDDALLNVVQVLRQREQEALWREAGQMTLL